MSTSSGLIRVGLAASAVFVCHGVALGQTHEEEFFERRVRPLLAEQCFRCHGADRQKSSLRLDSRRGVLAGGERGPAVVPGSPETSRLIAAVRYTDPDLQMPPKSRLSADQVADLERWVEAGAPWPGDHEEAAVGPAPAAEFDLQQRRLAHWAFDGPTSPAVPAVGDAEWPQADLDHFVLARLERAGLAPADPADRRTLIRRATFDLLGLPPTPDEVEAFVGDQRRGAWQRVVDRLLASPHFGERWGRHWLDLMRYAESRGHEFDFDIANAWQYRDYVIRALNADVPYDQLVREHIAGDLLEDPRRHPEEGYWESVLGTGFWYLGEEVHSPVDIRGDEAGRIDNKIDVLSKAFLGLTVACARCHDHKFDAISARDYYALSGYVLSSSYRQVRFDSALHNQEVAEALAELADRYRPRVVRAAAAAFQEQLSGTADYLLAAAEVSRAGPARAGAGPLLTDYVYEDFEGPDYEGWTRSGTAFADAPVRAGDVPEHQGDLGMRGEGAVNSHASASPDDGGRDAHEGTLLSPAFKVERDYVHFLIGGGDHDGETGVRLLVGGEVVRSATGHNNNRMRPHAFDVRELRGSEAQLEIIDHATKGWGNIGVDHIVFSDLPGRDALDLDRGREEAMGWSARIAAVAAERGLDAGRVAAWLDEVRSAKGDVEHPLHVWARMTTVGGDPDAERRRLLNRHARLKRQAARAAADGAALADYGRSSGDAWIQDGVAFGLRPVRPGEPRFSDDPGAPVAGVHARAAASSDPAFSGLALAPDNARDPGSINWVQAGRTLRTATFELEASALHYLVRGAGDVVAVVDGHRMVQGPLHGAVVKRVSGDRSWRWVTHRLEDYRGHRMHVELSARDAGSGFAVARIVQSDDAPRSAGAPPEWVERLLRGGGQRSPALFERMAAEQEALLAAAVERFGAGEIDGAADAREVAELVDWWAGRAKRLGARASAVDHDPVVAEFLERRADLVATIRHRSRTAPAMLDGNGVDERLLIRGNPRVLGEVVPRRMLEALGGAPATDQATSGRLALARQIARTENPLTARVFVNRVWHHLFGRGIVASVDNFGVMGDLPTHPELLDHLATKFVADGWSLKRVIRSILLSSTYQMSSTFDPEANQVDPRNLLLHRARVRRLQGEVIRDAILAVSGRLDRAMYGEAVPVHLEPLQGGRGRPGSGPVDGAGRRSIYLSVRRNFLSSLFMVFDYPIPFAPRGRRDVTNVPAQALALMNNPFVVQQAGVWASRARRDFDDDRGRVAALYKAALSRPPTAAELDASLAYVAAQRLGEGDEQKVWADLCHALYNVKEFIYLN